MKKLRKIFMMLFLCSMSILVVGCSSNNKISKEELIKKVTENSKSMKSANAKVVTDVDMDMAGQKMTVSVDMDMSMTTEPLVIKANSKVQLLEKNIGMDMYITEDTIYMKDSQTETWTKIKDETTRKSFEAQKEMANFNQMLDIFKIVEKDLKIEEKGSNYEVTYTGNEDSFKEILMKSLSYGQPNVTEMFKNMKIEKFDVKYVFDKNTLLPSEYEINSTMKFSQNSQEASFGMKLKGTYSDINNVKEIVIPDEVKNAK